MQVSIGGGPVRIMAGHGLTSKAPIASLKPCPSAPTTFSLGTTTFSKLISLVSEHRWPMLTSFGSTVIPAASPSTLHSPRARVSSHSRIDTAAEGTTGQQVQAYMKPVIERWGFSLGSVMARTKYQLATPAKGSKSEQSVSRAGLHKANGRTSEQGEAHLRWC